MPVAALPLPQETRVCVIGLGYVGLPLAVGFGRVLPTLGFDIHAGRIAELAVDEGDAIAPGQSLAALDKVLVKHGFLSADDRALHRAVFPRAYSLALVVTDAGRGDPTFALFGWREGVLERRGFGAVPCDGDRALAR